MSDGGHHPEILIIRRGHGGDHDDHHGGVWKIAFADFMTAMMAFFLVMWLISANEKTRASVARYFNPVKLVDATTSPRGLSDPKKDDSGITASTAASRTDKTEKADKMKAEGTEKTGPDATKAMEKSESASGREKRLDKALAENPYAALAEIAETKGPGDVPRDTKASRAPVLGLRGGEQFRDPFAPPSPPVSAEARDEAIAAITPAEAAAEPPPPAQAEKAKGRLAQPAKLAADTKSELAASLKAASRELGAGPAVDVTRTSEGLLVSLTDTSDFAMFSNGSAVPSRRVVLMMERVAGVLKGKPGTIVVRGYTDNKPFHAARYDNWHLSLDRAQVTHYMLVRGGLPDARISHVEGYADHRARPGVDPSSPLNRRIEILLKDPAPQAAAGAAP
jgi:chemotaxis protein MotB